MTQVIRGRRALVRGYAPPSPRAQIALVTAAFVCGAVLAGLLFVGIWRHTAAEGARAQASGAVERRRAAAARRTAARLRLRLSHDEALLRTARTQLAQASRALASARAAQAALARELPPRLKSIAGAGAGLAHDTSTLESELTTLRQYLAHPGPGGLDPNYVASQAHYLAGSARTATADAAALAQAAQGAQGATANLLHTRP